MDLRNAHSVEDEEHSSQSGSDYTSTSSDTRDETLLHDTASRPRITIENDLESLSLQPSSPGREVSSSAVDGAFRQDRQRDDSLSASDPALVPQQQTSLSPDLEPATSNESGTRRSNPSSSFTFSVDALVQAQVDVLAHGSSGEPSDSWQERSSRSNHRPRRIPVSQTARARSTSTGIENPPPNTGRSHLRSRSTSATSQPGLTEFSRPQSLTPAQSYDESPNPTNGGLVDGLQGLSLDEDESPYDARVEDSPEEPFYDDDFQQAIELAKTLASDISRTVSRYSFVYDEKMEINRIWNNAQRLEKFRPPETRTIGIVGESGSGIASYPGEVP